ncbi:electron transfer flavoprotein subunit alpha/FixB family protein [Fusobacterium sp. MFO224]|uniref:electron transfer flavoprotein subunit alpha/FixB family protein n=1 Tax=Fusobacterium sp. MFO224 TaxID=3378070 RepID=UPI003852D16D
MNILIYLNQKNNHLNDYSKELLNIASNLIKNNDANIYVVSLYSESLINLKEKLKDWNIKKIFFIKNRDNSYIYPTKISNILTSLKKDLNIDIIIMGNSLFELDIAPYLAEKLDFDYIPNISSFLLRNNQIIFQRLIYGTKALEKSIYNLKNLICIFNNNINKEPWKFSQKTHKNIPINFINYESDTNILYELKDLVLKKQKKYPLETSKIVIGVGKGIQNPKNFKLIEDLANILGAGIGVTRSVVDHGWRPEYEKIGQTGKIIKPDLYIAIGLSGAMQHMAGVKQARHIISINNNPNAEIFKYSDLGIVGDLFEIIPKLITYFNNL